MWDECKRLLNEERILNSISTFVFNHQITIKESHSVSSVAFLKGCRIIQIEDKSENSYFTRLFVKRHGIIRRAETFDPLLWEETDHMLRFSKLMYQKCFFTAILHSTK